MSEQPWQVRLAAKSIKKKDKLKLLETSLPFLISRVALDLGCGQGTLSYFVRQKGGFWVSADEDMANLKEAQRLLGSDLVQLTGNHLPFKDRAFDLALCLDYLEHLEADDRALEEIARVLKKGGKVILVTPHTGKFFLLHKLRSGLGLKLEDFGHKREGYAAGELEDKLRRAGLKPEKKVTYSRFFSEFLELILNAVYIKSSPESLPKKGGTGISGLLPAKSSKPSKRLLLSTPLPIRFFGYSPGWTGFFFPTRATASWSGHESPEGSPSFL